MNTIPTKLKILGFTWTVTQNQLVADSGNCFGESNYNLQNINIEPCATQQNKEETLLHEILHAIIWQGGLKESIRAGGLTEEQIVKALANPLYQVLKDNNLWTLSTPSPKK